MAIVGRQASAAAPKTATPPHASGPQAPPAARSRNAAPSFAAAKPKGATGLYLKGHANGNAGKYTLRVNRVAQNWANPKAVDDDRPQPTPEELATAKPTFKKKDNYIIEVEVVASDVEACPPGYVASISFNDTYVDSYFDDVKGFICACANADPTEVDLADWQASYQPDQPFAGFLVDCVVREKATSTGGTFTQHVFMPSKLQHPDA